MRKAASTSRVRGLRRSLALSVLALLLSVAMLAGSTFAWFSDEASTSSVRVTAGNLDIDLLKYSEDTGGYETVSDNDPIFPEGFLWEPGATQIVYLAVENKGSLAAKFNALLSVSDGGLADRLQYLMLPRRKYAEGEITTWEDLVQSGAPDEQLVNLSDISQSPAVDFGTARAFTLFDGGGDLYADNILQPASGTEDDNRFYFVLALHMMEGTDKSYMNRWVKFDISVRATQANEEIDSFGHDYDGNIVLPTPHSYILSVDGNAVRTLEQWQNAVKSVIGDDNEFAGIQKIVFGRWDDQKSNLPGVQFSGGIPLGGISSDAAAEGYSEGDIRGFYKDDALYILTADPEGYILISGSMSIDEKHEGFFSDWTSLREVDLTALATVDGSQSTTDSKTEQTVARYHVSNMSNFFSDCTALEKVTFGPRFDTSYVTKFANMFKGCVQLQSLSLDNFNTSSAIDIRAMFQGCSALTSLDLTSFNTYKVIYMRDLFHDCSSLQDVSINPAAFVTSNVTHMDAMFRGCSALREFDFSGFDTSKVVNMSMMFYQCTSLVNLDLSSFDTSSLSDAYRLVAGCTSLADITFGDRFKVQKDGAKLESMFQDCTSLEILDISSFAPAATANIANMFRSCRKLKTIFASPRAFDGISAKEEKDLNVFFNCVSLNTDKDSSTEPYKYAKQYERSFAENSEDVGGLYAVVGTAIGAYTIYGYFVDIKYKA